LEPVIFNFRIWVGCGLHEKVLDWIRIAKFRYPYTTAVHTDKQGKSHNQSVSLLWRIHISLRQQSSIVTVARGARMSK